MRKLSNKLTDNDIKKALEVAIKIGDEPIGELWGCTISKLTAKSALDLINRLQAENEMLKSELNELVTEYQKLDDTVTNGAEVCHNCHLKYAEKIKQAKSEAYKEFAERLKAVYADFDKKNEQITYPSLLAAIDCLLIGMVGNDNSECGIRN